MSAKAVQPIDDATAWKSTDFVHPREWTHRFTPAMQSEIERATRAVMARDIPFWKITRQDFPLPETSKMLAKAYDDLESGRGFTVLAGFPVDDYSYDERVFAYSGVARYLGQVIVQNYEGDMVVDVVDKGIPYSHQSRGYSSNKLLPFHTDGADVVGLLCLGTAADGGLSIIASAPSVYNAIARERPEYVETLMRGFYHHRRGQHDADENPVSPERIPVFSFHNGLLHCCYNRNPINWVEKEGIRLTDHEREVLDYFDSVVARPEMQLSMDLQKGDMQFVNNFVILHSRTEYQDDADHRRHLVRLWLSDPDSRRNGQGLLDLYVPGASRYRVAS